MHRVSIINCRSCRWNEKYWTLFQVITNLSVSEVWPHKLGVQGASSFVYFCLTVCKSDRTLFFVFLYQFSSSSFFFFFLRIIAIFFRTLGVNLWQLFLVFLYFFLCPEKFVRNFWFSPKKTSVDCWISLEYFNFFSRYKNLGLLHQTYSKITLCFSGQYALYFENLWVKGVRLIVYFWEGGTKYCKSRSTFC